MNRERELADSMAAANDLERPAPRAKRRIILFSPIPPMKTGTADYLGLILAELAAAGVERDRLSIAIDESYLKQPLAGLEIFGFPVVSYRQVPNVVVGNETRIYFLANNEFHAYCQASLSVCTKHLGGRIISVIHEPSCFMLMHHISANRLYGFDLGQMVTAMRHQFGDKAQHLLEARRAGLLPFDAEFLISVQGLALSRSDEIWTHSRFARHKLALESKPGARPMIRVSRHPVVPPVHATAPCKVPPKPSGLYRIGMFGWVAPSKRIVPAIQAFAWALQTQPAARRDRFELMVVGQLPPKDHYDPVGVAEASGIADRVRFTGFVGPEEFDQLVGTCDLILNLRFPSCGETSGTLEHALSNGIPVITTGYQAFAELPASAQVSPFWPREAVQLFGLFQRVMRGERPRPVAAPQHKTDSIATLIYRNLFLE
jgi:glycosyltransferase involved in cell wall biosynthesis